MATVVADPDFDPEAIAEGLRKAMKVSVEKSSRITTFSLEVFASRLF